MTKSKFSRMAMIGAATAGLMVALSSPAQATSNKQINLANGRGYMKFIDDGDVFQVCDTRVDDHGVTGILWVRNASGLTSVAMTVDDGGDNGCDKKGYNIGQLASYQMEVCWQGGEACKFSEWFNE
ncbi:hypothetical protein ACWGKW_19515 [Streptomyces sp. NPDC054766]